VTCQRGVCERGTDNCVSADSCTPETEVKDCVPGEKCADGSCEPMGSYCDAVTCERGVCSFAEGGCVNASDCQGDDSNCLEGQFCNEMNQCVTDQCQRQNVDCEEGGVCIRATGECENAESCESSADCVDGHECVDNVCRTDGTLCGMAGGDGGCPGNQICNYNPNDLTAVCEEPEVCETSVDCKDGRQCGGQTCLAPTSCQDDDLEPNNMMSEATVFREAAAGDTLSGTLCQGDTDVITFDTRELVSPTAEGTIVVDVTIPERDIGLGEMSMTITDVSEDSVVGSETLGSMSMDGSMRVTEELSIPNAGQYSVELTTGDEMSMSGVSYDMSVNIVSSSTVNACGSPQEVSVGQRLSGTIGENASSDLEASCASGTASNAEKIYALQLDRPQEIIINATPQVGTEELTVSLQRRCLASGSELACANDAGEGETETIQETLSAGTYYVVVQAPGDVSLSDFGMTIERNVYTTCGAQDNYCVDSDTAALCTPDGGSFDQVSCDAGCNASAGACVPPAGNRCGDAPSINEPDAADYENDDLSDQTVTNEVDLQQFDNAYQIAPGGCLGGQPRTDGNDAVFTVNVPADRSITVNTTFDNNVQGAIYLADSCEGLEGSCVEGAQGTGATSEETFDYSNFSGSEQTLYLVVDVEADQRLGSATVETTYEDIICSPGMKQCTGGGNVETCGDLGREYNQTDTCTAFPCANGRCQRPDTCMFPRDVTQASKNYGGVSYSQVSWGPYTNDVGGSVDNGTCDINHTDGYDLVWEVALNSGEALRASVQTDGDSVDNDPSMSIRSTCGDVSASNCLGGEDEDDFPADATYVASQNETVYVVGDSDDTNGSETWSANIETYSSPCSSSGITCNSQGDVRICSGSGAVPDRYACGSGCSNGFCDPRNSDTCYDAEDITSQLASSGGLDKTVDFGNFNNDYEFDGCSGDIDDFEVDGPEAVYKVEMTANDVLSATLDNDGSFDDPSLYVVPGCLDPAGQCLTGDHGSDTASVTYTASSAETVFLVADVDDGTNDDFKLTGTLGTPCTPGPTCGANGELNYCNPAGTSETTVCSSCCSTTASANASPGTTFDDNQSNPVTDTVNISGCSGTISEILVPVDASHEWEGDMVLELESPAGTRVTLHARFTGGADAYTSGVYGLDLTADGSLSDFVGESANGIWTFYAWDEVGGISGTLNSWGVTVACQANN
jgi:subtilisin-like proprotein convertase family protein